MSVISDPPERPFEYLDHTADVQIHAWGSSLGEALLHAALGMYNYMTPIEALSSDESFAFEAEGHDIESLLFAFLDECLFQFHTELRVCRTLRLVELRRDPWSIKAEGNGEVFDWTKRERGTEVKAITYSAMRIVEREGFAEVFVIVDI